MQIEEIPLFESLKLNKFPCMFVVRCDGPMIESENELRRKKKKIGISRYGGTGTFKQKTHTTQTTIIYIVPYVNTHTKQ